MADPMSNPDGGHNCTDDGQRHQVIVKLNRLRESDPSIAVVIAEQIYDNALVSAGLVSDVQSVVGRVNKLITEVVHKLSN